MPSHPVPPASAASARLPGPTLADPAGPATDPVAAAAACGLVMAPGSPLETTVRLAAVAAGRDCPVFLRGESGSGKELLARFLHRRSARRNGPFVAVNCAALPPQLIESELFGHRKGAFTGAVEDHPGRFRQAEGGTLFLDEVGDMPAEVQTRLLRALQEKTVSPVGDRREYPVDFRLVCATHKDLRLLVRAGRFREDLYYRIAVVEVSLPPLRERPGDLAPLLCAFLAAQLSSAEAEAALAVLPPAVLALPFPGNVRELRNLVERYAVLRELGGGWREAAGLDAPEEASAERAEDSGVPRTMPAPGPENARVSPGLPEDFSGSPGSGARIRNSRVSDAEILAALSACGWHRERASGILGITRRALQYRLAKMALNRAFMESVTLPSVRHLPILDMPYAGKK